MKRLTILLLVVFSTVSLFAQTKIIFDMDIDTDCDDAGALAILHALADKGKVKILATVVSTHYPYSAPCVEAINRYYGRPDIPIGAPKSNWTDTGSRSSKYAKNIAEEYETTLNSNDDAPNAVKVYRQILAAQESNSVVILTVGYLTNLRDLLESGPDDISPLSGVELVRQKVNFWVCNGAEYSNNYNTGVWGNFTPDPNSAAIAVRDWPGTIWFCGEGRKVFTGSLLNGTPANNPVRRIYELYLQGKNSRPSWDPISVLFAVRTNDVFWTYRSGDYHIFDNGTFEWRNSTNKNHHIVEYDTGLKKQLCQTLDRLMTQPPGFTGHDPKPDIGPLLSCFTDVFNNASSETINNQINILNSRFGTIAPSDYTGTEIPRAGKNSCSRQKRKPESLSVTKFCRLSKTRRMLGQSAKNIDCCAELK